MGRDAHDYLGRHPFLRTDDLDRSREAMKGIWSDHQVWLRSGTQFSTAINHVGVGRAGLTFVNCASPLAIRVRSTSLYLVYLAESGATEFAMNGHRVELDTATAVVVAPGLDLAMSTEPSRVLSLSLPRERVDAALAGRGLPAAPFERWGSRIDLGSGRGASLQSLCRWAADRLDREGLPMVSGLVAEQLSESMLSLLLDCLETRAPLADRLDGPVGKVRVSDLEAWIRVSLKQPLSLAILAEMAGASPRSVQMGFRRHRGCTPTEFIRRLRLEQVRRELERGDPRGSVTRAALDCGFFHLGRFARAYRERFGEHPSETLRRGQGTHDVGHEPRS